MIDQATKKRFINDYYRNTDSKKAYCLYLSEGFEKAGFGGILWSSIQSNWFSKGNLPQEPIKVNRIYTLTEQFINIQKLPSKEQDAVRSMGGEIQHTDKV